MRKASKDCIKMRFLITNIERSGPTDQRKARVFHEQMLRKLLYINFIPKHLLVMVICNKWEQVLTCCNYRGFPHKLKQYLP